MPKDVLQISLEHHRAGRLRQAAAGYQSLLEQNPDHAEAAHWLGVMLVQAGRPGDAVPLLERAVAASPGDPAFHHNLAQAYLGVGRVGDAIAAFDRMIEIEPTRKEALYSAAVARLARQASADAQAAVALLNRARAAGLDTPELHQHLGVALLMTGRVNEAAAECAIAIERNPEYAEAHYHLGVAQHAQGKLDQARICLQRAVELQPTYVRALSGLAQLQLQTGQPKEAEALFRKIIALQPANPAAYQGLIAALKQMGRENEATLASIQALRAQKAAISAAPQAQESPLAQAIADMEQKLTLSPEESTLHFKLARQANIVPPSQIPANSVSGLFDRYADLFDEHLRGKLDYRVPELIVEAIRAAQPRQPLDVLDLGCGTGLCGPLLRPLAGKLAGVDLSAAMIDKARERGVYDQLESADLLEVLRRGQGVYDLLVAADVLMYLGDLAPVFESAAAALRPGGLFAFSVEAGEGDRYQLQKSTQRFTHSRPYIERLARIFGFSILRLDEIEARKEAGKPVIAYRVVLRL